MRLFSSLTNRIFVASALLAVVSIAIGIYRVNIAVTAQTDRDLQRGLNEARSLIEENRLIRLEHFTKEARLIADLPRLKAAIEPGDAATARGVVEEYQQQLAADLFMVTDRHGRVLVQLTAGDFPPDGSVLPALRANEPAREASTFVVHQRGILQLVSVPIWINPDAPNILGTLSVGFSLDRRLAARFRLLTNSEIAFGVDDRILVSTLPSSGWTVLAPLLRHEGDPERVWLGDDEYLARTIELGLDGTTIGPVKAALRNTEPVVKAIILRSRTERLGFLSALHTSLLVTAGIAVLAATVLSYGVARTVTRPLGTITATMREMAATGDLTRKIPLPANPRWEDEDARLLASTFNTMTESIDRFQREAGQRERLSSLGRLSTVIAHEIRNPLMIIKSALRGLRKDQVTPSDVEVAVADIEEEIARLNRLVTEVLDFARPIRFELAPADVNALCVDAAEASGADGNPLPVAFSLDRRMPSLVTDAERLRLVLVNVLTNARCAVAARDGQVPPQQAIALATHVAGGTRAVVEVRDRGVGIAPEDLPRIFDPYFTTRRTGTGLGLAISRNIVEGLGGTIAVQSRQGAGTTVRIVLPLG
ncbi:MAG: ATP-binding protein [Vicinamibacterales bacterium]